MFDDIIAVNAVAYSVPEAWIRAVIATESSWRPSIISADGGYGLMQLMPDTARALGYSGDVSGLLDPETNIGLGTKLLGQLRARYGDDVQAVYSAYNSGGGSNYLTNPTVAQHVANFVRNLESVVTANPLVTSTGTVGAIIVVLLLWYWTKKKGK
jgi:soluble lytic murein transglycosylase-like protein